MLKVAALALAAGASRRMGPVNKLLAEFDGVPMVLRVVEAALSSRAATVIVVTGHDKDAVEQVLQRPGVQVAYNPDFSSGLSSSLRRGVAALPNGIDGVLVCLADMPRVTSKQLDRIIAAFDRAKGRAICVPTFQGKRGNPVLWAKRFFPAMQEVKGDVGARLLIREHAGQVYEVEMGSDSVLTDVDSPEQLADLAAAEQGKE